MTSKSGPLDLSDALVGTYPQDPQTGGLALSPFWTCPEYAPLVALWGIHRQCASGDMPYMISQDLRPSESWIPGTRSLDLMGRDSHHLPDLTICELLVISRLWLSPIPIPSIPSCAQAGTTTRILRPVHSGIRDVGHPGVWARCAALCSWLPLSETSGSRTSQISGPRILASRDLVISDLTIS